MAVPGHGIVEQRSLRYHVAIAERLSTDDTILARTRARLEASLTDGTVAPYCAEGRRHFAR